MSRIQKNHTWMCHTTTMSPVGRIPDCWRGTDRVEFDRETLDGNKLKLKLTPFGIAHHSKGNPFQVCLTVSTE